MNKSISPRTPGARAAAADAPVYTIGQRVIVKAGYYGNGQPQLGTVVGKGNGPRYLKIRFDGGKTWATLVSQIIGAVEE